GVEVAPAGTLARRHAGRAARSEVSRPGGRGLPRVAHRAASRAGRDGVQPELEASILGPLPNRKAVRAGGDGVRRAEAHRAGSRSRGARGRADVAREHAGRAVEAGPPAGRDAMAGLTGTQVVSLERARAEELREALEEAGFEFHEVAHARFAAKG